MSAKEIVPVVVTGPPVRPVPVLTCVRVPAPPPPVVGVCQLRLPVPSLVSTCPLVPYVVGSERL